MQAGFVGIEYFLNEIEDKQNICVVSPDAGGMHRAQAFHDNFDYHGLKG